MSTVESKVKFKATPQPIPVNNNRCTYNQRLMRLSLRESEASPPSPFYDFDSSPKDTSQPRFDDIDSSLFASSPRNRYPNFASYFKDVVESKFSPGSPNSDFGGRQRNENQYQFGINTYRYDPRTTLGEIDEHENKWGKCERYGEISTTNISSKNKLDNKSFAQHLVLDSSVDSGLHNSDSSASTSRRSNGKKSSIQELFKTFGKKVQNWRHDDPNKQSPPPIEEFRSRSKSLDCDSVLTSRRQSVLDDCGATYEIFDKILKEGAHIRRQELEKRRASLPPAPFRLRGQESVLDSNHSAILFRDSRGLPVANPFLDKINLFDLEEDESQIFVKFFKFHKCYDLIPTSAKLVVFDTQLLVKKAFYALVYNGVRAAPLWDSAKQQVVGMLTITDFIKILQMYYTGPGSAMEELEHHKLETWRQVLAGWVKPLVSIGPDASLYEAVKTLVENKIHRLPVIDPQTGDVLYILTHKRILRFLFLYINELPRPSYLSRSIRALRVGTLEKVETAMEDTPVWRALEQFVTRRVSALPIIDADGRLVDIYAKFDVINLAAEKTYNNLEVPLKDASEHRHERFEGVQRCTLDDTLYDVCERIVKAEVHRLVVVDDEEKVVGIISLSDLLQYLVLRPGEGGSRESENGEDDAFE